jgi:hypothetical protein
VTLFIADDPANQELSGRSTCLLYELCLRGYWKKSGLPEFMCGGGKSNRLKTQYVDCWLFSETGHAIAHRSKGLNWIFMSDSRNSHHQACAKNIQTNSDYYFHLINTIRHQNLDFENKPIKIKIRTRGVGGFV